MGDSVAMNGKILSVLCAVAILGGCAGSMEGVVRETGQPMQFQYEQGMSSDSITAVLGDETFKGKAVMDGATTSVGTGFGSTQFGYNTVSSTVTVVDSTYTGNFVAVLFGSKGSTMNCQLRYADSSGFTSFGGVGVCKHSDGRVIDVVW